MYTIYTKLHNKFINVKYIIYKTERAKKTYKVLKFDLREIKYTTNSAIHTDFKINRKGILPYRRYLSEDKSSILVPLYFTNKENPDIPGYKLLKYNYG